MTAAAGNVAGQQFLMVDPDGNGAYNARTDPFMHVTNAIVDANPVTVQ